MIARLRGRVLEKSLQRVVLDVQGVGFEVAVPLSTSETLHEGGEANLLTYLHVREDALQLYGFGSAAEKELFIQLISISGIGPRIALNLLSARGVDSLRQAIGRGDVGSLTAISGVGRKMAERIVVELREKMGVQPPVAAGAGIASPEERQRVDEAVLALVSLGFPKPVAEKAVNAATAELEGVPGTEELVKRALQKV